MLPPFCTCTFPVTLTKLRVQLAFFGTVTLPLIWVAVPVQTPLIWVDVPPPTTPVQVMFPLAACASEEPPYTTAKPPNTRATATAAARANIRMASSQWLSLPLPGTELRMFEQLRF